MRGLRGARHLLSDRTRRSQDLPQPMSPETGTAQVEAGSVSMSKGTTCNDMHLRLGQYVQGKIDCQDRV
jgi:hypothetical protein